jgi:AraC-like DNA-binding protein
MSRTKNKIIDYFQNALSIGVSDALLVSSSSAEQRIHSVARFLMIISGQQEIEFFTPEGLKKTVKGRGSAQYCGENGYMYTKYLTPSKVISVSYYGKLMRCMHIDYNGADSPPRPCDTFYHTNAPISGPGRNLLKVLDGIAETGRYQASIPKLLESLLQISIEDIKCSEERPIRSFSFSYQLWKEINHYIKLHFKEDLSRKSIAKAFNVSPSHISHLFKKFGRKDFTSMLRDCRLEYAAALLMKTRLSVDEIAEECNYSYTSYFIRSFKKKYKITPNSFRCEKTT